MQPRKSQISAFLFVLSVTGIASRKPFYSLARMLPNQAGARQVCMSLGKSIPLMTTARRVGRAARAALIRAALIKAAPIKAAPIKAAPIRAPPIRAAREQRRDIAARIRRGDSDAEIRQYYVDLFGESGVRLEQGS